MNQKYLSFILKPLPVNVSNIDNNQLDLIHNDKLPSSFHRAHWKRGHNPDLSIVSSDIAGMCTKLVMVDPLYPIGIQVNAMVRPTTVPFKRQFNYRRANWENFTKELEQKIKHIKPVSKDYDHKNCE